MTYDVDYFIEKFETIPEENWCVGEFINGDKYCANGHCGTLNEFHITQETWGLLSVFKVLDVTYKENKTDFVSNGLSYSHKAAVINDGKSNEYQQLTPKQRILAALNDIKKLQQKEQPSYPDLTKQLAILPKEETPDIIFQKV